MRGGSASTALVALALGIVGGGAALGHQALAGQSDAGGLLSKGSRGAAVQAVQRALGMPAGAADGVFGGRTEANVRLFQTRHGLLVDGVVGPQTRAALGLAGSAPAASASRPASPPDAQPGTTSGQAGDGPVRASATPGALQGIARCESGGNPRAIGGGGNYRGKYQFTRSTWRSLGGSGDPAAAPEAEQDRRAALLYRRSGSSAWPSCG